MRARPPAPAHRRRRAAQHGAALSDQPRLKNASAEARPGGPTAAAVLRRALLLWGTGHLALGDRRGWLLLALQPLTLAAVAGLAAVLVDGTRWIAVFPALVSFIAIWMGQAMHAHRQAVRAGAPPGGEFQIATLLPLVVALLSAFWLVGGERASPAATLQHYVAAWQAERPAAALPLFTEPVDADALATTWQAQGAHIEELVTRAAATYGDQAGLDPARPFNSLRFAEPADEDVDHVVVMVDVVRRQRVETNVFGFIPTATQQTVIVERLGHVRLRAQPAPLPAWLPLAESPSRVWLIEAIELATSDG